MTYESKRDLRTSRDTYKRNYEADRKTIESLAEERDQLRRTVRHLADELGIGGNYREPSLAMPSGSTFNYKMLAQDIEAHRRQEAASQRLTPITTPITKAGSEL